MQLLRDVGRIESSESVVDVDDLVDHLRQHHHLRRLAVDGLLR